MPASVVAAAAVHVLTASGSVCGLLALHFTTRQDWQAVFACLGAALVIDAVDGPLARKVDVQAALPRFSGIRLDDVVDYLNYCVVPAFILMQSGILSLGTAVLLAAAIAISSLYHFADSASKTEDGFFVGFPAIWNVVIFYIFAFDLGATAVIYCVVLFVLLTPVPLKWVHPLRGRYLRPVTWCVVALWTFAALRTLIEGFPAAVTDQAILAACALYVLGVGLLRSLRPDR